MKWYQRSKDTDLLQGNSLTKYFMAKASGRKRKKHKILLSLQQEEGLIVGDDNILL